MARSLAPCASLPIFGLGILLWLGDGTRVYLVSRSLNAGISPAVAILVATMGALLTIIPFTPAGLGVVELGVGSLLVGVVGLDPGQHGRVDHCAAHQLVVFWSLLVVGTALYLRRTRRDLCNRHGQCAINGMNPPRLNNPWPRIRGWVQINRAQAEIAAITALALGLIVIMMAITLVVPRDSTLDSLTFVSHIKEDNRDRHRNCRSPAAHAGFPISLHRGADRG